MTKIKKKAKILSFEEILKLFTDLDTDEKMTFFNVKFKDYLSNKTVEEKKLVGKIFLLLTRDYAEALLKSLEQRRDVETLEEMQKMLISFSQRATPSV